jgi:hypothetical protein
VIEGKGVAFRDSAIGDAVAIPEEQTSNTIGRCST